MRCIFLVMLGLLSHSIEINGSAKQNKPLLIPHDNHILVLEHDKIIKRLDKQQKTPQAALQSVISIINHLDCYKVNCTKRGWFYNEYAIEGADVHDDTLYRCYVLKKSTEAAIKRKFIGILKKPIIDDITGDDLINGNISIYDCHGAVDNRLKLIKENSQKALCNINNGCDSNNEIAKILMRSNM